MKNLRYCPPRPPKGRSLSKNALRRAHLRCESLLEEIKGHLALESHKRRHAEMKTRALFEELKEANQTLHKLTRSEWELASIGQYPPTQNVRDTWELHGVVEVGIKVDFRHIRSIHKGDRDTYLKLIAKQFAGKAYEHALTTLRII